MKAILLVLPALFVTAGDAHATEKTLPVPLELNYTLRYGGMTVGRLTKTLTRDADGGYRHHSRSVPEGMAKLFTSVEWFEEGRFEIVKGEVRPLNFLEYRMGADKPHRHSATFDWTNRVVHYAGWPDAKLPAGTQDQGSVLYALMLNPPTPGAEHKLPVSTGKKLREYRYVQVGTENLKTVFGTLRTQIIERRPLADDKDRETYRVWLAPDRRNLPVRVATEKRGQETIMELESAKGGLSSPAAKP